MGKRAKAHRRKVEKRNNKIKQAVKSANKAESDLIKDLIEREIKNGQYDSDFMHSMGLSSDNFVKVDGKLEDEVLTDIEEIESNILNKEEDLKDKK